MNLCNAYVRGWRRREPPEERICDYSFTSEIDEAEPWPSKADADMHCAFLFTRQIEIRIKSGGKYVCTKFHSEHRAAGDYVVACEIPVRSEQL